MVFGVSKRTVFFVTHYLDPSCFSCFVINKQKQTVRDVNRFALGEAQDSKMSEARPFKKRRLASNADVDGQEEEHASEAAARLANDGGACALRVLRCTILSSLLAAFVLQDVQFACVYVSEVLESGCMIQKAMHGRQR